MSQIKVLRLISEPTAAAIAYGINETKTGNYIVYDLGGGTFDVSVLSIDKGVFKVLSTRGNTHLGGDDVDILLSDYIKENYEKTSETLPSIDELIYIARDIKHSFFNNDTAINKSFDISLSLEQFNKIISPLIDKTLDIFDQAIIDS